MSALDAIMPSEGKQVIKMANVVARTGLLAVLLGFIAATPAAAETAPPASPQRVQAVLDCRKLISDTARLACYDQAVGALGQALSRDEIVAVDHSQLQEVRRQAFGFQLPSLGFLDRGAKPEEVDKVTLKVESARLGGDDKWVLTLEGGQVWRQIDDGVFSRDPKPGAMATISRAVLGSYIMTIGGHSPVRVHRDQ